MKIIYLFISLLYVTTSVFAQQVNFNVPDSLKNKSFEELEKLCKEKIRAKDIVNAKIVAKTLLYQSKDKKNYDVVAKSFLWLSLLNKDTNMELSYLDSVTNLKNNKYIPLAYVYKGNWYNGNKQFEAALKYYLLAKKYAYLYSKDHVTNDINMNIAYLKSKIGKNKEALQLFKGCHQYWLKKKNMSTYDYLKLIFGLADSFHRNSLIDSASYYNKLGYLKSRDTKNIYLSYFTLNEATIECEKGNYKVAIDSILKSLPKTISYDDSSNTAISYFYLGKSYYKLKKEKLGVNYLKKMDTIIQEMQYLMPEERGGYQLLIQYYEKKQDLKNQLLYTKRLLAADSIVRSYSATISSNLITNYEIPELMKQRDILIKSLKKQAITKDSFVYVLVILLLLAVFAILYYYRTKAVLKQRFEQLVLNIEEKTKTKEKVAISKKEIKQSLQIPEEVIQTILNFLEQFEMKNAYIEQGLTQAKLAKKIGTNSSYLSKVINSYKNKKFRDYLNELRIDYAVKTIKENTQLRKFTIKAIANEFGFNNSESFSTAFYKQTGIYPSYYIKELEKVNS